MPKKILIVDDDREKVKKRSELLRKRGHEVETAFNGTQGLKILKKETFDLLILDLDMPKMRGDELLERIKDNPNSSSLRVLVVTGMEMPHITRRGDRWEYDHHPITRARELGPTQRGWDEKFKLVRKWYTRDWYTLELQLHAKARGQKSPQPPDTLTDREFLEAVEEMFLEPKEIDRPRKETEPWRILIVEDDQTIRKSIKKRLEKNQDYEILLAEDGEIALKILGNAPVDLVILDLEMPRTTGDEVLSVLGSNFVLRNIPVIVYTGVQDWDKTEDVSLRRKTEKVGIAEATYEKKKQGLISRIFKLDTASMLLSRVVELLEERRKWGYGYLREPLTFFRNKENRWMPGALEYYQPVDTYQYTHIKSFFCSYCLEEKPVGSDFKHACEYNHDKLFPSEKFNITTREPVLICSECVKELYEKNPNLGKYTLRNKEKKVKEKLEQEQLKKRIKKPPKVPMNQKVFEKVKSIINEVINEVGFNIIPDEIKPESDLEKDIFKDSSLHNRFVANIKVSLELEYDIDISSNDVDWFDTVQDIVDCVDEKLKEKRRKKSPNG